MGAIGNYEVASEVVSFPPGATTQTIEAPTGKKVLSGGYQSGSVQAIESFPSADGSSWNVTAVNNGSSSVSATLYAVCAEMC